MRLSLLAVLVAPVVLAAPVTLQKKAEDSWYDKNWKPDTSAGTKWEPCDNPTNVGGDCPTAVWECHRPDHHLTLMYGYDNAMGPTYITPEGACRAADIEGGRSGVLPSSTWTSGDGAKDDDTSD